MSRVSTHFSLGIEQPALPFVDVELESDTRLYLDPRALLLDGPDWGGECVSLVQDFFGHVLRCIRKGEHEKARTLLAQLREPNETRLGQSRGRPRGRALGDISSRDVWEALSKSRAIQTGMLTSLEETVLVIPGIGYDIVSDITTNLIREPLIAFTQMMCAEYGIPMTPGVDSGPLWNPQAKAWASKFIELPVPKGGQKLVLVPKELVRRRTDYNVDEYFNNFVLTELQAQELQNPNSGLVQVLRSGARRVTKKDLKEKYGSGKGVAISVTEKNPQILERYRRRKDKQSRRAPSHGVVADQTESEPPDWDALLSEVLDTQPGKDHAEDYHVAVRDLLAALFYPHLTQPRKEWEIHEGRKRIDIVFTNASGGGFFWWVAQHYSAPYIVVECKNYKNDVANKELDQLAGRFAPNRGRVGLMLSRSFKNEATFGKRCRDTAQDDRGFIIHLTDDDLEALVEEARDSDPDIATRWPRLV